MQIDLLQGSLLCTLEHGEMNYMTGREDLDAPRFCRHVIFKVMLCAMPIYVIRHHWLVLKFCRQQFNPPEGHSATITIALSFTCIVEPSILSCKFIVTATAFSSKFIVVKEKAILSARMAKIRTFTRILEIVAEESGFSSATI